MEWLWIILRYLFPLDPVRQCIEALRERILVLVNHTYSDEGLDLLASEPDARLHLEAILIDYESTLRMTITARACQIAGRRFKSRPQAFYTPTRAKPLEDLLTRINTLVALANDIERLAQREAVRLQRERDADPLGLAAHGSTDAALRAAAHHEAPGVSRFERGGPQGLILSSARSARPSKDEAVLTAVSNAKSRAPPIFYADLNPKKRLAGITCEVAARCQPTKTKGPLSPAGLSTLRSAEPYCAGAAGAAGPLVLAGL